MFEGNGKVRDFLGNYNEYRLQLKEEQKQAKLDEKNAAAESAKLASAKRKLSYKEQQELQQLEKDIEKLNAEKHVLTEELSSGITDHQHIRQLSDKLESIIQQLDEKEMRWLELSEWAG